MTTRASNTILVVEDNPAVCTAICHNLSKEGFQVASAGTGLEGLEYCQTRQPDLIISDIMMPEMDGIEFCKQVRALPAFTSIPFIFLTARSETDQKILGLRTGADDYLIKPLDMDELTVRIDNLISKAHKHSEPEVFSGRLEEVCLTDLLQMFEVSQKQGRLHLQRRDGPKAWIDLQSGMILGAHVDSGASGEDAFFELLDWADAGFRFEPGEPATGDVMKSTSFLLIEGMRLLDERKELLDFLPQPDRSYTLADGIAVSEDSEIKEAPEILQLLAEGPRTFADLLAAADRGILRTEIALAELIRAGSILPSEVVMPSSGQPVGIMLAHSAELPITLFLETLGRTFNLPENKAATQGVADYVNIELDGTQLRLFILRGEKRFRALWKLVTDRTSKALFLTDGSVQGRADADYFAEEIASYSDHSLLVCDLMQDGGGDGCCNPESTDEIKQLLRQLITQ